MKFILPVLFLITEACISCSNTNQDKLIKQDSLVRLANELTTTIASKKAGLDVTKNFCDINPDTSCLKDVMIKARELEKLSREKVIILKQLDSLGYDLRKLPQ